jgi:hypothetical protein
MDTLEGVSGWVQRPLPVNAAADAARENKIDELVTKLPGSAYQLDCALDVVRALRESNASIRRMARKILALSGLSISRRIQWTGFRPACLLPYCPAL